MATDVLMVMAAMKLAAIAAAIHRGTVLGVEVIPNLLLYEG